MLEVIDIKDQKDGSAILELSMSEDIMQFLVEYAVNDILRKKLIECKDDARLDLSEELNTELLALRGWDDREEDLEIEKYVGP